MCVLSPFSGGDIFLVVMSPPASLESYALVETNAGDFDVAFMTLPGGSSLRRESPPDI